MGGLTCGDYSEMGVAQVTSELQYALPRPVHESPRATHPRETRRVHITSQGNPSHVRAAEGYYCSTAGTELACKENSSASHQTAVTTVSSGVPSAQPVREAGCQYDTQCKGDRICSNGSCVPPIQEAPASPPRP